MTVPIANILYLLCYAWKVAPTGGLRWVRSISAPTHIDLFARVLAYGTTRLVKTGLDREYVQSTHDVRGVRGKVDFSGTVKRHLLSVSKASCEVDDLSDDVIQNRILKTTIHALASRPDIDGETRRMLRPLLEVFKNVKCVSLDRAIFTRVRVHRNNSHYSLLLHVCKFIFDSHLLCYSGGGSRFSEFNVESCLDRIFEKFIRNFYDKESDYIVRAPCLTWHPFEADAESQSFLPQMKTDAVLRSATTTIVVDAKFYTKMFTERYDIARLRPGHIYQIYAYIRNVHLKYPFRIPEGMLIYPTVQKNVTLKYVLHGYSIVVATVDLNMEWQAIHSRLLALVAR